MKPMDKPTRQMVVTLAVLVSIILCSIILSVTGQVACWVAQIAIALSFGRICFLAGWGFAKFGKGWRV